MSRKFSHSGSQWHGASGTGLAVQRRPGRLGLGLHLVVAVGQRGRLRRQQRLVLVDHVEQPELGGERRRRRVQPAQGAPGALDGAEVGGETAPPTS